MLKSVDFKVNNSFLTGDSIELSRVPEVFSQNVLESPNTVFKGSLCTSGYGTGVVIKTGDNTVIGQTAILA